MHTGLTFWIGFHVAVLLLLALDLFVLRRGAREVSMREAAVWSVVWVALSLGFCAFIHFAKGPAKAVEFLTGYVIEYSLSADNLFLFVVIFGYFKVPRQHQHRVLLWGILGALAMRGAMIGLGVQLVERFHWILYAFGIFLLVTGVRMFARGGEPAPGETAVIRACRKIPRVTPDFHGSRFIARTSLGWMLTPLAVALVVIDVMDLLFAVDSIPAIFAVTTDPFIVYTSNVCAILGLRSLYFVLAGAAHRFEYLHYGLAAVLVFIGAKMLLANVLPISSALSLLIVALLLGASIAYSAAVFKPPAADSGKSPP
ncbi:MAG TPA: TerC family protein [Chthoniobacteraceae bacterium]|jgi:tellurite resistance protein TerC|nr:TerC family protein [Chthoniobacteraceae bacterium]